MNDAHQPTVSSSASPESSSYSASLGFASNVPLVHVEVVPLHLNTCNDTTSCSDDSLRKFTTESPELNEWISSVSKHQQQQQSPRPSFSFLEASVKLFLWKQTLESSLTPRKTHICIQWKDKGVDKKKGGRKQTFFLRQGHLVVMNDNHQKATKVFQDLQLEHPSVIFLPQLNPTLPSTWPCICYGYAYTTQHRVGDDDAGDNENHHHYRFHSSPRRISVTAATMIRILPPVCTALLAAHHQSPGSSLSLSPETQQHDLWKEQLTGECCQHRSYRHNLNKDDDDNEEEEVLHNHNPETVRQLLLRIKLMLSQPIRISTTARALEYHSKQSQRKRAMRLAIQEFYRNNNSSSNMETLFSAGGNSRRSAATTTTTARLLLVHSPHAGSGKTLLVQACFRKVMSQCNNNGQQQQQQQQHGQEENGRIHIIRVGPLMAKYGVVYIDTALETILHQIVLSSAMHGQAAICIILDHFDALFPGGNNNINDAAAPALHAMTAHLKTLVQHLYQRQEFPFPKKNPLYNLELDTGTSKTTKTRVNNNAGAGGCVLSIRLCLVAIVTCPDDSSNMSGSGGRTMHTTTILDAFGSNTRSIDRFRLPPLTAHTRWRAFDRALAQLQDPAVIQSSTLREKLPFLAAAAVWARGSAFGRVAQQVQMELRLIIASNQNHNNTQDKSTTKQAAVATVEIFSKALATVRQMTTTAMASSSTGSNVQFLANDNPAQQHDVLFASNVGGNAQAKRALVEALSLNPKRRQLLTALGLSPPTGILLYGAPGTGKTLLAKAVAKLLRSQSSSSSSSSSVALATGGAFISLSSSDIVRAQVGTGEKLVVQAFETAKMNAPSVIFIDEFQALFTERKSSNSGSGRLTSTLLSAMDGCRRWAMADRKVASLPGQGNNDMEQERRIVILAATNTPWMVDKAFLRPGRFDEVVHVDLPDLDERQSILKLQIDRMKTVFSGDAATMERICTNLAQSTEGFSGADLVALCRSAAVKCLLCGQSHVREHDFVDARRDDAMVSSSPKLVERIKKWQT